MESLIWNTLKTSTQGSAKIGHTMRWSWQRVTWTQSVVSRYQNLQPNFSLSGWDTGRHGGQPAFNLFNFEPNFPFAMFSIISSWNPNLLKVWFGTHWRTAHKDRQIWGRQWGEVAWQRVTWTLWRNPNVWTGHCNPISLFQGKIQGENLLQLGGKLLTGIFSQQQDTQKQKPKIFYLSLIALLDAQRIVRYWRCHGCQQFLRRPCWIFRVDKDQGWMN